MTSEQRKKLNRLSFEATLWLPEEISIDLSRILQSERDAPNMFELLLRTRTHPSGPHCLNTANITRRDRTRELPNPGLAPEFKNGQVAIVEASIESGGEMRMLSDEELKGGFHVPEGDTINLQFPPAGDRAVRVSTQAIRALHLVETKEHPEQAKGQVLEIFPLDIANQINRSLSSRNESEVMRSNGSYGANFRAITRGGLHSASLRRELAERVGPSCGVLRNKWD